MRKMLSATALIVAVLMVATTSHAETVEYTGKYTGSLVGAGLWVNNADPDLGPVVGDFGGYDFIGIEGTPVSVTIEDATGSDLAFTVAQDLDGDLLAGGPGEPSVAGCGTSADLTGVDPAFQPGVPITVFIRSMARVNRTTLEYSTCPGLGTHGTITLTVDES